METYTNKDFYLSAYLIAQGNKLQDAYRERGLTVFTFEKDEKLDKMIGEFYSMSALIDPLQYSNAIRSLKSVTHSLSTKSGNQHDKSNKLQGKI